MMDNDRIFQEMTNNLDIPMNRGDQDPFEERDNMLRELHHDSIDYIETLTSEYTGTSFYDAIDARINTELIRAADEQSGDIPPFTRDGMPLRVGILLGLDVASLSSDTITKEQLSTSADALFAEVNGTITSHVDFASSLRNASWRYYTYNQPDPAELIPVPPEPKEVVSLYSPLIDEVRFDLGFDQDDHLEDILIGFGLVMLALDDAQKK